MQDADHILIPLLNGTYALAQVSFAGDDFGVLYMTDQLRTRDQKTAPLAVSDVLAVIDVALDAVPNDHWPIIGYDAVPPMYDNRNESATDIDIRDPAIVEAFANALHGLYPWDGFPDPDFFTNLLLDGQMRPNKARMTADLPAAPD